jgi:nitroreductase
MDFAAPEKDEVMNPTDPSPEVLKFLSRRRSALVKAMISPGPDESELELILRIAARVPDHRKLFPWRFLLFQGDARAQFGDHLVDAFRRDNPDAPSERTEFERARFLRAPLVVGVVSSLVNCPRGTPIWEQKLSAGAVCQNLLLAARASGFSAQWLSEWYAFDARIDRVLGLESAERMAGFIYIGTPSPHRSDNPKERPRPDMSTKVKNWP